MSFMSSQKSYSGNARETRETEIRLNEAFRDAGAKKAKQSEEGRTGLKRWMRSVLTTSKRTPA